VSYHAVMVRPSRSYPIVAALVVATAGCQHLVVTAQPATLARHAGELSSTGRARVEVDQGGTISVGADDPVMVTFPGNEHSYLWGFVKTGTPDETRRLTIASLVAGCGPEGHGPNCLASHAGGAIRVGTQRRLDLTKLAFGVFGAVATVVGTTCLAVCSNVNGWAWVGTGLGIVTFVVPLSTVY
jgi:hypothetical protein